MPILDTSLHSLKRIYRGKVRDSYELGDDKLLIIATDRISAFDVILEDPIPYKGMVLQALTDFWFEKLDGIVPNHLTGIDPTTVVAADEIAQVKGRSVVAMKLKPIPIECVVRGYIIGGGWKDYQATGKVCGIELPKGLQMGQKLPEPIFTPAAKAEVGTHDENISYERVVELYGEEIARTIKDATLELYRRASEYAATRGIIIADTKFEFGIDANGQVRLMDEVLTPDSSRFWPAEQYTLGISPPSFDKQFVRDLQEFYHSTAGKSFFQKVDLYLMRNASDKLKGIGFAQAGNFYPDFMMWMIDKESGCQYLTFIDPKGLRNVPFDSPKLNFAKEIKNLQKSVNQGRASKIILNSVILSSTRADDELLNQHSDEEFADKHILFLDTGGPAYLPRLFSIARYDGVVDEADASKRSQDT